MALNLWFLSLPKFYAVWTKNNSNTTCLEINNGFMNLHEVGLTTGCLPFQFFFLMLQSIQKGNLKLFLLIFPGCFFQGWVILLLCVGHSQNRVFSVKFQCWCKSLTNLLHEHPVTFIPEKRWTAVLVADTMMNVWNEIFCILAVLLYFHTHSPVFTEICCFSQAILLF